MSKVSEIRFRGKGCLYSVVNGELFGVGFLMVPKLGVKFSYTGEEVGLCEKMKI